MAKMEPENIRNIALVGHSGSGKTMLSEALLFETKKIPKMGSVMAGTTVSDFDDDEKDLKYSVETTVLRTNFKGRELQVLDTPGSVDFIGGVIAALGCVEAAVITVCATKGIEVVTRKVFELTERMNIPRIFVITKIDGENARFQETLAAIKDVFAPTATCLSVPDVQSGPATKVFDLLSLDQNASDELKAEAESLRESIISADDALLEKFFEGEEISEAELQQVYQKALLTGSLVPVLATSAEKGLGIDALAGVITNFVPDPLSTTRQAINPQGEEESWSPKPDGPLTAQVFRVASDPFVGKVSYFRVYQGTLTSGSSVKLRGSQGAKNEKLGHIALPHGKEQIETQEITAGQIGVVSKVESLSVGDTLGDGPILKPSEYPKPMVELAVFPTKQGDETKLGANIRKIADTDPTFQFMHRKETNEFVISGMGDQQLRVILGRLKKRFNLEVGTKLPTIPYLETITAKAQGHYRHKKQTGGAGQFGEVYIEIWPLERGTGYEFEDAIVGGVIPGQFLPSVDKGVQAAMQKGPVAGFPVVDVHVKVYDGKSHPVDSKDIAFQLAGRGALYDAMEKAKPVLLEPWVEMEIVVPPKFMGDITGDLNSRRGRIQGMDIKGGMQVLHAMAPLGEVLSYSSQLKAITGGEGMYSLKSRVYEIMPQNEAAKVIQKVSQAKEEKEKK
ncbi:MAG: elongation factor G [Deltaproteobacteria bacterium]|nr:elongation factor G [Deltaproteobacteria bacterium]